MENTSNTTGHGNGALNTEALNTMKPKNLTHNKRTGKLLKPFKLNPVANEPSTWKLHDRTSDKYIATRKKTGTRLFIVHAGFKEADGLGARTRTLLASELHGLWVNQVKTS